MRIVVVGAGEVGFNVAQMLSGEGHDVVIVDWDAARVERTSSILDALVLRGNGASPKMLEEAGIRKSSLLVATTGSDETNITACLVAKHHGAERTVARIHNSDYYPQNPFAKSILGIDFVRDPHRRSGGGGDQSRPLDARRRKRGELRQRKYKGSRGDPGRRLSRSGAFRRGAFRRRG